MPERLRFSRLQSKRRDASTSNSAIVVSASLLFQWRKLERQGALTAVQAGEAVVPASELAAARAEISKLQRILGKKTLKNEILKEAVEYATEKKWIARSPLLPGDGE